MSTRTGIEWADATWNPIIGCSLVSPGCTNCYAMGLAARLGRTGDGRYAGLTTPSKTRPVWSGVVRVAPEATLLLPLRWKRPRRIFVNSMSDLFHPSVPDGVIMQVWRVMGLCPQHQFQILTKRPDRMRDWVRRWADVEDAADPVVLARGPAEIRAAHTSGRAQLFAAMLEAMDDPPAGRSWPAYDWAEGMRWWPRVLPNVHLGVSIEDQRRADERIPVLRETPAAKRFLSYEPALGPVDGGEGLLWKIDWVIAGGESGRDARPPNPEWFRTMRDHCARARAAFFFKQWGEFRPVSPIHDADDANLDCTVGTDESRCVTVTRDGFVCDDDDEPPRGSWLMERVGKRLSGAALDGRHHREFPAP